MSPVTDLKASCQWSSKEAMYRTSEQPAQRAQYLTCMPLAGSKACHIQHECRGCTESSVPNVCSACRQQSYCPVGTSTTWAASGTGCSKVAQTTLPAPYAAPPYLLKSRLTQVELFALVLQLENIWHCKGALSNDGSYEWHEERLLDR